MLVRIIDTGAFVLQALRRNQDIGAVSPSSRHLARQMIVNLGDVPHGSVVIELGPGTGVFTQHLLNARSDIRLVAVEFNATLARRLARRHPNVDVVQKCASELESHLADLEIDISEVGGVLCGLPLLSIQAQTRDRILKAVCAVLPPKRRFVAFTYYLNRWTFPLPACLNAINRKRVWRNLPPSWVLAFEKAETDSQQEQKP